MILLVLHKHSWIFSLFWNWNNNHVTCGKFNKFHLYSEASFYFYSEIDEFISRLNKRCNEHNIRAIHLFFQLSKTCAFQCCKLLLWAFQLFWCFNPHVTFYPLGNCSLARIKGYANVLYKIQTLNGYNQITKLICCNYISS